MLALLFLFQQLLAPEPPSPNDRVVEVVLDAADPRLGAHGACERVALRAEWSGTLHVWTRGADGLDLCLRIEDAAGALVAEDEDGGGGTTPYARIEVVRGRELVVFAAASKPDALGAFELVLAAAPETDATRTAATEAELALADARRLHESGDLEAARAKVDAAIAALLAAPGAAYSDGIDGRLQKLASEASELGLREAHCAARRSQVRHRVRTLPEGHRRRQNVCGDLAVALADLGELQQACEILQHVVEVDARTLPPDHEAALRVRSNLAGFQAQLGDLAGARATMESVVETCARTRPDDDDQLQFARSTLAIVMQMQGDVQGARVLQERVLAVLARKLPADDIEVLTVKHNLAVTLLQMGDIARARVLFEEVVAGFERTLAADDPMRLLAQVNLAAALGATGAHEGERDLLRRVVEVYERALPPDHPDLLSARQNLAIVLLELGDLAAARPLAEAVLAARERTLPEDHADLGIARQNLAHTLRAAGELAAAAKLEESVLAAGLRTMPADESGVLMARSGLATTLALISAGDGAADARQAASARCVELLLELCRVQAAAASRILLTSAPREAAERCAELSKGVSLALTLAPGAAGIARSPSLERAAFEVGETTRGAAWIAAESMRRGAASPDRAALRERLRAESDALAALARKGTSGAEFQEALARREAAQRELQALARTSHAADGERFDLDALVARLPPDTAAVAFRRYDRHEFRAGGLSLVPSLCAHVVRAPRTDGSTRALERADLGDLDAIEITVRAWRAAIGAGLERGLAADARDGASELERGRALRRLVLDPLLPAIGDARRLVIVLDDVLHLVPLDALPLDPSDVELASGSVGDRWSVETRCTLSELLAEDRPALPAGKLIALGGAAFNSSPLGADTEDVPAVAAAGPAQQAEAARGSRAWEPAFAPLTYTGLEAREIVALHAEVFGEETGAILLEKRRASRAALVELAPRARWLHVATHGWYAPESIRSRAEGAPSDTRAGIGAPQSGLELVRGLGPMLLSGLALAGANLPEDAVGRAPGLVTAEELATFDLAGCELAVLSACDTNVGERRAGQGMASLQVALQMAGARSTITSLWKVPDEATRELMLDFYRRLWVEKQPASRALWEAKRRLRQARDEDGRPLHATRDWAAWVLTGAPG